MVTRKSHPPNWYQMFSIIFNQLIVGRVTSWVVRCLMKVNLIHMLIFTRWWVGTVWSKEEIHISPIVTLWVLKTFRGENSKTITLRLRWATQRSLRYFVKNDLRLTEIRLTSLFWISFPEICQIVSCLKIRKLKIGWLFQISVWLIPRIWTKLNRFPLILVWWVFH